MGAKSDLIKTDTRAAVHQGGDVVEPGLACVAEVGALGHELAQFKRQVIDPAVQSQRRGPMVFSFEPRGLGACGSQNRMSILCRRASSGWQAISEPQSQSLPRT